MQWFHKWAVPTLGSVELPRRALRGRGTAGKALEVGPSEHVVRLFTIEVTLDQILGNFYHFIQPIHRIKNLQK
jgi:hypothetical protein